MGARSLALAFLAFGVGVGLCDAFVQAGCSVRWSRALSPLDKRWSGPRCSITSVGGRCFTRRRGPRSVGFETGRVPAGRTRWDSDVIVAVQPWFRSLRLATSRYRPHPGCYNLYNLPQSATIRHSGDFIPLPSTRLLSSLEENTLE